MLTIKNITKIWKRDVNEWRIGKIETLSSTYLFKLYIYNRRHQIQINLERNPIGVEYELWCWDLQDGGSPLPHATPLRIMLDRDKLISPNTLIEQMEKLLKVV
jgi:hypothetical protein